jgi:hypothetical protein
MRTTPAQRRMWKTARTTTMPPSLLLLCLLAAALRLPFTHAGEDLNTYHFGSNPNAKNRMYFPDAASVLRNLDRFSSLHIRFHSCAWSPNQAYFDDDGENYDGEEQWYQGRVSGSAANAGFSLYGTLKNRISLGGCRRGTYINSFFTNYGADVLVSALGLNVDSSYSYCHEYDYDSYYDDDDNNEGSGDEGDDDASTPQSATLGCTLDGKFATALFTDGYCQGKYFWNTTKDSTYNSYNQKLNGVRCQKIWTGKTPRQTTANGYLSKAHEILYQADVCDTMVDPLCPDPWGKKSRYEHKFIMAGASRSTALDYRVRRPLVLLSHALVAAALVLAAVSYRARNKERLQEQGLWSCLREDVPKQARKTLRSYRQALKRSRRRRRRRGASNDDDETREDGVRRTRSRSRSKSQSKSFELT